MPSTPLLPQSVLHRAYKRAGPAATSLFIVGACLIGPFASYAGLATANYAVALITGTTLSSLGPILRVLGFLITTSAIMAASGLVLGVVGFAAQSAARAVITASHRKQRS